MPSRFDYIKYDELATAQQSAMKTQCQQLEELTQTITSKRWREAALMNLEYFYMCVGKGIRDDQIARNGQAELQEARNNE